MIGIEFTYNNGVRDWYDPVDSDKGFIELGDEYIVEVNANTYKIAKVNVKNIRKYELCSKCGYELSATRCNHCGYLNPRL